MQSILFLVCEYDILLQCNQNKKIVNLIKTKQNDTIC